MDEQRAQVNANGQIAQFDIKELRLQIDSIDDEIRELFLRRMEIAKSISEYKRENDLPVLNESREKEIIARLTNNGNDEMSSYIKDLYEAIFDLSRSYQESS